MGDFFSFLFYFLLFASAATFLYALTRRSWIWMLISGIALFPDALYFSGYPPYPWAVFVPLIQIALAVVMYQTNKKNKKGNDTV